MKRNLRFWTRFTGESAAGELVVVAVLLAITTLGPTGCSLRSWHRLCPTSCASPPSCA